ncbi:MAG: hypothetical protein GY948_02785, partial [Alphaproteobacteria bacterium]|nr:hypothetical protein [Alphaproteobacteria bacterium]
TMLSFGVGEWCRVFPVEQMMRSSGGYIVRRDSGDILYRRVLERYVQLATEAQVPHAIFPEGQLSKDGRMSPAKFGILTYLTRHYDPARSAELVFVPIGCNYDRIPEDTNVIESDTHEFRARGKRYIIQSGVAFALRTIWEMIAWRRSYGFACAKFGCPISFNDWLKERGLDWPAMDRNERYAVLEEFGNGLMQEVGELVPVMPVPLLCHALLEHQAGDVEEKELLDAFKKRIKHAEERDATIILPRNDPRLALLHAINQACARNFLHQKGARTFEVNSDMIKVISYYANSIDHVVSL